MKDVIVRLWPTEPIPSSYFGLVKRLIDALPLVEAIKHSACIEGARMAFTRVKTYWAEMEATTIATQGLAVGRVAAERTTLKRSLKALIR